MLERVVSRGHEFTIHPWPLWVSMVAIAFGAVALLLYSLPQAGGRRAPQMGCMPLLIVILVGSLFVGMPMLAWVKVGGPYGGSAEIHSYRVFRPFLERATWFSVLGASLFLLGLMVQRSRKVQGRPAKLALLSGAFALLAGAGVMAYTTWFVALDCLPRFEREGHGFLHVGRERAVRTLVSCGEGWPTPPVQHLTATEPGTVSYDLEIATSTMRVRHTMRLTAGEELGSPRFQLREGNRWVYELVTSSRSAAAFGASTTNTEREEVVISLGDAEIEHGLRFFPLVIQYPGERPGRERLLAWNGGLYTWPTTQGGQMRPFLPAEPMVEPFGGFILPGMCSGLPAEGPAAPLECRERANPVAATGAAVLRILTVGAATYVPPRPVYHLRQAVYGRDGGGAVPAMTLVNLPSPPPEGESAPAEDTPAEDAPAGERPPAEQRPAER